MIAVTVGFMATVGLTPGRAIVSTILGALLSFVVAMRDLPWRGLRVSLQTLREDLRFGVKVHLGGVFQLASYRLDYLVMSAVLPAVQLGLYGTANTFMLPLSTISAAVAVLLTPKVARLAGTSNGDELVAERQRLLITAEAMRYTVFALMGGILIAVLGPFLLPVLLGDAYSASTHLMWILTPGYVCLCFSSVVAAGAAGMGRAWVTVVVQGAAILVTLVLLPLLLPRFEAEGAAMTSSIAYGVSAAAAGVCLVLLKRQRSGAETTFGPEGSLGDPLLPGTLSS
jgi:O-antigen/teichoic acid export membrane protein